MRQGKCASSIYTNTEIDIMHEQYTIPPSVPEGLGKGIHQDVLRLSTCVVVMALTITYYWAIPANSTFAVVSTPIVRGINP